MPSRAEHIVHHRALADSALRIADPRLRAEVEALATGTTTPAEFMRFVDTAPQAWRGLHRTVTTYLALTDDQRAELVDRYQRQVAAVQAELDRPSGPPEPDETWEAQESWLE
jgi:hypothetical protein